MTSTKKKTRMSRPVIYSLIALLVNTALYAPAYKWWALLLAPWMSFVGMFFLAASPSVHKHIFGDRIYSIKSKRSRK